jgi:hypothetical protein
LPPPQKARLAALLAERRKRREARARADANPFGLAWVRAYLPHWLTCEPSRFHRDLCGDLAGLRLRRGQRLNRLSFRGSAKTAYTSKAYPLWCALNGTEPLTLLLSDSGDQAAGFLSAIKDELTGNAAIARDYPAACGVGPVWRADRVTLRNGATIAAKGSGSRIRGIAAGVRRPTLIVVDDANKKEDAYSPTLRRRVLDWLKRDVMPAGEPGVTNFVVVGTAVHRDAVVCDLARNPAWQTRRYRAIERFPDRTDLWARWEKIASNLADPDRLGNAAAFYAADREAMDAGAELLWPERFPLDFLMAERMSLGEAPFGGEYQDDEGQADGTEFPSKWFDNLHWFEQWPAGGVATVLALDPSKGLADAAGDYQAFVGVALLADGSMWCEATMLKVPPEEMAAVGMELARRYAPVDSVTVETNAGLGLLVPEFERAMAAARYFFPLDGVENRQPKRLRIRRLGGYLSRGQIKFRDTPGTRLLVRQLQDFGTAEHDDGPDALELAVRRLEQLTADRGAA